MTILILKKENFNVNMTISILRRKKNWFEYMKLLLQTFTFMRLK